MPIIRLIALVVSVALASMNLGVQAPVTQRGIQCPTAAVQTVKVTTLEKSCCGKLVAKTEVRKPKEGEAGFKQCRCAERKASEHEQQKQASENSKPVSVAMLAMPEGLSFFPKLVIPFSHHEQRNPIWIAPAFAPPTPPP